MTEQAPRDSTVRMMVTFDDLAGDLVWPKLLRAGVLALHPGRLFVAFLVIEAVRLILWACFPLERAVGLAGSAEAYGHLQALIDGLMPESWTQDKSDLAHRLVDLYFSIPLQLVRAAPVVTLLGGTLSLVISCIGVGAISRMAATEFSIGRSAGPVQALGLARSRWLSLVGAVIGPVVFVWILGLVLAVFGFALARWPGVNILGAILFGGALLAGVLGALMMFVYVLGFLLLIPAVTCDGADAVDAIQRAYAYVLGRPLRLVSYLVLFVAQGLVLVTLVSLFFAGVDAFAERAAGRWAGEDGRRMLFGESAPKPTASNEMPSAPAHAEPTTRTKLFDAGAFIVRRWSSIPRMAGYAYLLSYACCGATLLYLGVRRVNDGQDMNELWSPEEDRHGALGAGDSMTEEDAESD